MIVQSVVFSDKICTEKEIYYRSSGDVRKDGESVVLSPKAILGTDTYMNLFDASLWYQYTGMDSWILRVVLSGTGKIKLLARSKEQEYQKNLIIEEKFSDCDKTERWFCFSSNDVQMLYFVIEAESEVCVHEAQYLVAEDVWERKKVSPHISLIICTYRRREALEANLERFRGSRFFDEADALYGKLSIRIVDNASELSTMKEKYIKLYPNPNTGGSGGFTRGIIESRKDENEYGITHVVFMDDDVEVQMESFYRMYALLLLRKNEYKDDVVAGRMFRMDEKRIQYTAAEIWNSGEIRHIGWNADMTRQENLWCVNDNTGAEYSGWWFACFPMEFVRENIPLPFFLHCDDVEYGLRHGGTPMILNGIQVWHETYEYRQSPMIVYYDTRNPLIVNAMYDLIPEREKVLQEWKRKITEYHIKGDYLTERMIILGMWDFLKGRKWFEKQDVQKKHKALLRKKCLIRYRNALLWRVAYIRYGKVNVKEKFN